MTGEIVHTEFTPDRLLAAAIASTCGEKTVSNLDERSTIDKILDCICDVLHLSAARSERRGSKRTRDVVATAYKQATADDKSDLIGFEVISRPDGALIATKHFGFANSETGMPPFSLTLMLPSSQMVSEHRYDIEVNIRVNGEDGTHTIPLSRDEYNEFLSVSSRVFGGTRFVSSSLEPLTGSAIKIWKETSKGR